MVTRWPVTFSLDVEVKHEMKQNSISLLSLVLKGHVMHVKGSLDRSTLIFMRDAFSLVHQTLSLVQSISMRGLSIHSSIRRCVRLSVCPLMKMFLIDYWPVVASVDVSSHLLKRGRPSVHPSARDRGITEFGL